MPARKNQYRGFGSRFPAEPRRQAASGIPVQNQWAATFAEVVDGAVQLAELSTVNVDQQNVYDTIVFVQDAPTVAQALVTYDQGFLQAVDASGAPLDVFVDTPLYLARLPLTFEASTLTFTTPSQRLADGAGVDLRLPSIDPPPPEPQDVRVRGYAGRLTVLDYYSGNLIADPQDPSGSVINSVARCQLDLWSRNEVATGEYDRLYQVVEDNVTIDVRRSPIILREQDYTRQIWLDGDVITEQPTPTQRLEYVVQGIWRSAALNVIP